MKKWVALSALVCTEGRCVHAETGKPTPLERRHMKSEPADVPVCELLSHRRPHDISERSSHGVGGVLPPHYFAASGRASVKWRCLAYPRRARAATRCNAIRLAPTCTARSIKSRGGIWLVCQRQVVRYSAILGNLTPLLRVGDAAAAASRRRGRAWRIQQRQRFRQRRSS